MRIRTFPFRFVPLLALYLASCNEKSTLLQDAAPQVPIESPPVAPGDALAFGEWQSKAELQILLEGLEPGQFFSVIEGEYHNGLHRYRVVIEPFADQGHEMWATYWGLDQDQFYETELMLLRKGFQRQHRQIYQDEAKRPYYQLVYVRPFGSSPRGNGLIEDTQANVSPELTAENPSVESPTSPPASPASETPSSVVANAPGVAAAQPTVEITQPVPETTASPQTSVATVYGVGAGDTLSGIAKKFKVTVESIKAENKLRGDMLRVGQKLKIPAAKRK